MKKKIQRILKKFLKSNNSVEDIWMYGNFTDSISDLDLIVIYKKKPVKLFFPNIIKKLIADGSVIFVNKEGKKNIILFEDLKIFSIKKNKSILIKIQNHLKKKRYITSFLERYYERRSLLKKRAIYNLTNVNIRNIKSIFFSYENFLMFSRNDYLKKENKRLFENYNNLRIEYSTKNLSKKKYKKFINNLINYDNKFFFLSSNYLEKKFKVKKKINFIYKFKNNLYFSDKSNIKKNIFQVPQIFFYLYYFYSSQNLAISKKIAKDLKYNSNFHHGNLKAFFSNNFKKYLKKKINFINVDFLNLRKNNFKKGLYRFSWYLK